MAIERTEREELQEKIECGIIEALRPYANKPYTEAERVAITCACAEFLCSVAKQEGYVSPKIHCMRHKTDRTRFLVVDEARLREMEASGEIDDWERPLR